MSLFWFVRRKQNNNIIYTKTSIVGLKPLNGRLNELVHVLVACVRPFNMVTNHIEHGIFGIFRSIDRCSEQFPHTCTCRSAIPILISSLFPGACGRITRRMDEPIFLWWHPSKRNIRCDTTYWKRKKDKIIIAYYSRVVLFIYELHSHSPIVSRATGSLHQKIEILRFSSTSIPCLFLSVCYYWLTISWCWCWFLFPSWFPRAAPRRLGPPWRTWIPSPERSGRHRRLRPATGSIRCSRSRVS